MARVTVEDCIEKVENRFELVMLAAQRARSISSGAQITVDRDNDKNPVVALREIADNTLSPDDQRENFIKSLQKYVEVDEMDDSPDFGDDSDIDDDDPMLAHPVTVAASRSRIFESSGPPRNFDDQPFAAFGRFEDITGVDD